MSSAQKPLIEISSPLVVTDTFYTTITYHISTQDNSGTYECLRMYTEFVSLRNHLSKKWPGVYIPAIPDPPLFSNISLKPIKTYKKQVEYFLEYITINLFLYTTEDCQNFLKSPNYVKKKFVCNYYELAINYQAVFYENTGKILTDEMKRTIKEKEDFFHKSIEPLVVFRDKSEQVILDFKVYQNLLFSTSNQMLETEKLHLMNWSDKEIWCPINLSSMNNHYLEFFNWAESEIFEIEAMLEAISALKDIEKIYDKLESTLFDYKLELDKIEQNKISFSKIFSFKSKDKFVDDMIQKITEKENEISAIKILQSTVIYRLLEQDIPSFNASRIKMYTQSQNLYNDVLSESLESLSQAAASTLKNITKKD